MRSTTLLNVGASAIERELGSKYDVVKAVSEKLVEIEAVAGINVEELLAELQDAQDFSGISVVTGEVAGWDPVTKVITVPTVKGDKGDKGNTGDVGAVGPQGPIGPRGLTGPAGRDGVDGTNGVNGVDGIDGVDGVDGRDLTVEQITYDGNSGKFTWHFSDGTTYVTPDLRGEKGDTGSKGDKGDTGTSVHHIKGTSTTDNEGDFGSFGEIDTYTVYGDAAETINLGYFRVNNGAAKESQYGLMYKSTYDTNSNGVVDNSERLGGELPSHYVNVSSAQSISGDKTFVDDVVVQGNFTVNGTMVTVNAETVEVQDNLVVINKGEVGPGVTAGEAGIIVDRGTATDYKFVFDEASDSFKVGETGSLQKVATREDAPIDGGIAVWDDAGHKFVTTKDPSVNSVSVGGHSVSWNSDESTLDVSLNGATLQVGQEQLIRVRNSSGVSIANGMAVMVTGTIGNSGRITIAKANLTQANAKYILGVVTETIDAGADGFCTAFGKVRGVQTNGAQYGETWLDGDVLYVKDSGNGALTKVVPTDSQVKLPVAIVISSHATNGTLFVRVNSIDENHAKVELAGKVDKNAAIVGGTATKITYDAKGLVTGGTTLVASDIPSLDASKITTGIIDAARLPSYVDDVLEFANQASFPATGESGKIYVALDTNKAYRWSGSVYVYITSGAVDSVNGQTGVVNITTITGNAATATKLQTSRNIALAGAIVGSVNFDGSANVNISTTLGAQSFIQSSGLSTSWGSTNGINTGAVNVSMGTSVSATWLLSGTSGGVFRSGIQSLDSTGVLRVFSNSGYIEINGSQISGNITALTTGRTIGMTGDVTWTSAAFNGSANVTGTATLANSGVTAGTYSKVTVDAKGRVTAGLTPTMEDIPDAAFKRNVRCGTTANITLSGTQTIDGIAVVAGDRVLVKEQTTASQNGIYVVSAGAWTRALDADSSSKMASALVAVDSGTLLGGKLFDNDFKTTDTLGTTAMTWSMNLDDGSLLTAGSTSVGVVKYNGTTAVAGQFDGGTTTPVGSTRLNYGGYFYPTYINLLGTADTATASSHVFVETASDGFIRPKTLANFKTEMFASPTLVTPNIGVATGTSFNSITGLASVAPIVAGTAAVGTSTLTARQDHVHPAQTTITGNAGTATALQTARTLTLGLTGKTFNGSTNVSWTLAEMGAAPIISPEFTGIPVAPTATVGTNTTQLATTAYVVAEINKIEEW